jgi:hypothetical protein
MRSLPARKFSLAAAAGQAWETIMLFSTWARSPAATYVTVLGALVIAAISSIAAAPATTTAPACHPSVVHFISEPKPLSAKANLQPDWPILERLAAPYVAGDEAAPSRPAQAQQAMNSEPVADAEPEAPRKRERRHHRRWR